MAVVNRLGFSILGSLGWQFFGAELRTEIRRVYVDVEQPHFNTLST